MAFDAAVTSTGGPRFLIVGRVGYGKTVALLDLAQHLAEHHDDQFGTPVVLSLGSWRREDDNLTKWMVRVLCDPTGPVPNAQDIVTGWIAEGRLAPLLDGLDDIADDNARRRCVRAINEFIDEAPAGTSVVVASRTDEYVAISRRGVDRLAVNAAVELEPLSRSVVGDRLREMASCGEHVADLVQRAPHGALAGLLRVPLWLWLATTLDDTQLARLARIKRTRQAQAILTNAYLDCTLCDLGDKVALEARSCRRFLAVIAAFLADSRSPDSVTFRFEDLTPLHPGRRLCILAGLVTGPVFGLTIALIELVIFGPIDALVYGPLLGLSAGIIVALGLAPEAVAQPTRFRPRWPGGREMLRQKVGSFQWTAIVGLLAFGLGGYFGGLRVALVLTLIVVTLSLLFFGFVIGLLTVLVASTDMLVVADIDEGWSATRRSLMIHVAIFGFVGEAFAVLAAGLPRGLVDGLLIGFVGLASGLVIGPFFLLIWPSIGADAGAWYLLMQRQVRRHAYHEELLPRDPVRFVRAAVEVGILRQTGGGVQFRHSIVADRLSACAPTSGLADLRQRIGTDKSPSRAPASVKKSRGPRAPKVRASAGSFRPDSSGGKAQRR